MTITVPAGAYEGQVLRLEGMGEPSYAGGPRGLLLLTLSIRDTEETRIPLAGGSTDKTVPASDPGLAKETIVPPGRGNNSQGGSVPNPTTPALNIGEAYQPSTRRQGPGVTAILLVGLAVLVVVASIGFFYFQGNNRTTPNTADTIATTQAGDASAFAATATSQNQAQATANAVATANANISATAQANNNNPTPTPTSSNSNPYPPAGATLVLNDPLINNNNGNNWVGDNSNGACNFTGRGYDVTSPQTPLFQICAAQNTNFSNFAYEIELTFIAGNCGAIIFRSDANDHFYFFRICPNGTYQLLLYTQPGYATTTFASGNSSAIHAGLGQSNVVAVLANNNHIIGYVNYQPIVDVYDSTYSQGRIGVVADNDNSPTEVVFSNAKVWTF